MIDRIFSLMEKLNITPYRLSKDLKIGNSTVNKWKDRKSLPSAEMIIKLAEYFGVTTDYLLTGKDNQIVLKQIPQEKSEVQKIYEQLDQEHKSQLTGFAKAMLYDYEEQKSKKLTKG